MVIAVGFSLILDIVVEVDVVVFVLRILLQKLVEVFVEFDGRVIAGVVVELVVASGSFNPLEDAVIVLGDGISMEPLSDAVGCSRCG